MLKLFETGKSHMAVLIKPHEQQPAAAIKPAATTTSSSWFSAPRVSAQGPAMAMGGSSNTRQQRSVFEKYNADMLTTFGERGGVTHGSGMVIDEPVGIITIEDVIEEVSVAPCCMWLHGWTKLPAARTNTVCYALLLARSMF